MKGIYDCEVVAQSCVAPGVMRTILTGAEIARNSVPGQFVNVRVCETSDPLLRRPFSVHAVYPDEGLYSLLYVLVGKGTQLLSKVQPGIKLSVVGPLGNGFDLGEDPEEEHVVVAGGCGAAPLHFLAAKLCEKWGCGKVTVLCGAQTKKSLLCQAEFESFGGEVSVSTDDGTSGYHGTVTGLLEDFLADRDPKNVRVYSCGPHPMLKRVAEVSGSGGVKLCQVSLENHMSCGVGVCLGCVQKIRGAFRGDESGQGWHHERVCKEGPVFDAEDVIWE